MGKSDLTDMPIKYMIISTRVINEPCIRTFGQFLPLTQHYKLNSGGSSEADVPVFLSIICSAWIAVQCGY